MGIFNRDRRGSATTKSSKPCMTPLDTCYASNPPYCWRHKRLHCHRENDSMPVRDKLRSETCRKAG